MPLIELIVARNAAVHDGIGLSGSGVDHRYFKASWIHRTVVLF